MGVQEIGRRLIDGVWRTGVAEEASPNGNGGSQPGAAIVRGPFPFAYNTPGINDGVEFYTPTANDVLLDAWIEIDTAFDGTNPRIDIGTDVGLFLSNPDSSTWVDGDFADAETVNDFLWGTLTTFQNNLHLAGTSTKGRWGPGKFIGTTPLAVWVSQTGLRGGTAVGGAAGAGKVYIVTATPVAFS